MSTNFYLNENYTHTFMIQEKHNSFFFFGPKNNTVAHVCLAEVKSLTKEYPVYISKKSSQSVFWNLIIFNVRWRDAG